MGGLKLFDPDPLSLGFLGNHADPSALFAPSAIFAPPPSRPSNFSINCYLDWYNGPLGKLNI